MSSQTSQLLELLSSGHQLSINELEDLINHKIKEDQFLEFKSGMEIEKKDSAKTIRDYLCGFANSDGGILIIGVEESSGIPVRVDGCDHTKGDLLEWASRCLTEVAGYFSPIPKFQKLLHPNGEVLICIAQRSLNLIPQIENRRLVYYLRIHDQTLKAPEYLISDLLLGRKQKPDLEVVNGEINNFIRHLNSDSSAMDLGFDLKIKCENRNIAWIEDGRWGIVAWNQFKDPYGATISKSKPSKQLLSYIDIQELSNEYKNRPGELLHFNHELYLSKPFDTGRINLNLNTPIRLEDKWFSYDWMAALYLVSKNTPPIWFQIKIKINNFSIQWVEEKASFSFDKNSEVFNIKRLVSERPVVALRSNSS